MSVKNRRKRLSAPVKPQILLTLVWHMGLTADQLSKKPQHFSKNDPRHC